MKEKDLMKEKNIIVISILNLLAYSLKIKEMEKEKNMMKVII